MMQQSQGMSGFPMATQAHGSMPIPHTANMYYGLYYK